MNPAVLARQMINDQERRFMETVAPRIENRMTNLFGGPDIGPGLEAGLQKRFGDQGYAPESTDWIDRIVEQDPGAPEGGRININFPKKVKEEEKPWAYGIL
jgi:hypothetical protein